MPSCRPSCPHCRSSSATDIADHYKCLQCGLFFGNDGKPFTPPVCTRCESPITWDGEFYDCANCGRAHFGPFPRERGARLVVPEGGYSRGMPGTQPGKAGSDVFTTAVRRSTEVA